MRRPMWLSVLMILLLIPVMPARSAPPDPQIGGGFTLTNQDGQAVTERSFRGKPVLLYFGFTACPDVCPTDMARLARIQARVRKQGGPALTLLFVTLDPARDTPAKMKGYVSVFGPDVVGLTGTPAQIAAITDRYHVYYRKVPYGRGGEYMMDHSTFAFVLDRDGRYVDHFGRTADEAQAATRIATALGSAPR